MLRPIGRAATLSPTGSNCAQLMCSAVCSEVYINAVMCGAVYCTAVMCSAGAPERWERWDRVPSQFEILAATFG